MSPSETLLAAADRVRDLAAAATPGPWEQGERCVWEGNIGVPVVADCEKGEGGVLHEHDARWIAALSPALAPMIERWLRESAESLARHEPAWRDQPDVYDEPIVRRTPAEVDALVEHHFGAALGFARAILGEGTHG